MSEGTTNTQQPTGQPADPAASGLQAAGTATGQDAGRTFTQEDVNRLLAGERRTQEQRFADAVAKAKHFDELADKEKSELQKAVEAREQMEQELATERASRLRLEVAQAMGLPTEMAARLQGGTKEELEADANALARLLPRQQAPNGFRDAQGKPGDAPTGDWLRQQIPRR
mgnify:FL=1